MRESRPLRSHPAGWARRGTTLKRGVLPHSASPSPRFSVGITGLALTMLLSAYPPARLSAQAFPTTPPRPTPLSPVRFPPFKEATLASGLQLVVVEHHEQPVVSVSLSFRAGGIYAQPGKEGLAELAAELLTKGTATRSAEQIAATIEGVGGSLGASASDDFLT